MQPQKLELIWKIIFGQGFEIPLDPNKAENLPRIKAENKQQQQAVKMWLNQGGQAVLKKMTNEVQTKIAQILYSDIMGTDDTKLKLSLMDIRRDIDFCGMILDAVEE